MALRCPRKCRVMRLLSTLPARNGHYRATGRRIRAFSPDILASCLRERSGNVAFIAAASIVPLLAIVGGGVDMGRAYMARTQLQSACDAGVLAGRHSMSDSGEYGDADKAKARKMFDFNFEAKAVSATGVTFTTNANSEGQVEGWATADVPTVVMDFFGKDDFALSAECMAELQIANADVMFVLDTTGSMGGTRITGLRDAVRDFHRTLNAAIKDENTRVRYGFVPYSMTVNASDLIEDGAMPTTYFRDSAPYESREAQFNTAVYIAKPSVIVSTAYETYASTIKSSECNDYADNDFPSNGRNPITSGSPPAKVAKTTYSFESWVGSGTKRTCTRKVVISETEYLTKYAFTNWRYKQLTLDTSIYKTGAPVSIGSSLANPGAGSVINPATHTYADAPGNYDMTALARNNGTVLHNVGVTNSEWNGCLEERDTVAQADWDPIPDGALDLDLDLAPNSPESRWRPIWDDLAYLRTSSIFEDSTGSRSPAHSVCPAPMKLFTEVDMAGDSNGVPGWLESYLNGLVATGNTYHDIGMIWGGRLSSTRGIFADNVNQDDKAVSRHLIFMTDGQMEPYIWGNNAYGIEVLSNRIAPSGSDTAAVAAAHTARFLASCQAVKDQGITLWVIAFGTSLASDLITCSSDGRAYHSTDSAALRERFSYIASQVANLRLGS
jgi:Flp pilus assembly protein TadG